MVFSSQLFVFFFLPLAVALYVVSPRRGRNAVLTVLSYLFYGWGNPAFCLLMAFSTAVDWVCGLAVAHGGRPRFASPPLLDPDGPRTRGQRTAVLVSIVTNLGLLAIFKYAGFAAATWNRLVEVFGPSALEAPVLAIVLPLGISFYTFQSMSYTLDVYRGRCKALLDPLDFACYVAMFPQLVAGPIVRFAEIAEQLTERRHTVEKVARGLALFSLGMAKKILLANPCGALADLAFDSAAPGFLMSWLGTFAYGFQIYFDFSGYSDMAVGLALLFGFVLPRNFNAPYRATSITDFWRRWHISLSTFLRDNLYLPLGGNRLGSRRTAFNLAAVMVLGGLWHGAAWNFVVWGAWHGVWLGIERAWRGRPAVLPRPLQIARTFLLVSIGWVFFRADDLGRAVEHLAVMVGFGDGGLATELLAAVMLRPGPLVAFVAAAVVVATFPQAVDWSRRLDLLRILVCIVALVASLAALATQGYNPFIYFIF